MKFWIFQIQRWNRRNHPTYDWHNFRLKIKNNQPLGIRCIHKFYDTLKKNLNLEIPNWSPGLGQVNGVRKILPAFQHKS